MVARHGGCSVPLEIKQVQCIVEINGCNQYLTFSGVNALHMGTLSAMLRGILSLVMGTRCSAMLVRALL